MNESIDRNWYSPESRKQELAAANAVLAEMKKLEKEFSKKRKKVVEKTEFGTRIRYIDK